MGETFLECAVKNTFFLNSGVCHVKQNPLAKCLLSGGGISLGAFPQKSASQKKEAVEK